MLTHLVKDVLELELCQGRAFDILDRSKVSCHFLAIFLAHRLHLLLCKLLADRRIVSQIGLCANDETRDTRAVVVYFGEPLFTDVFERSG